MNRIVAGIIATGFALTGCLENRGVEPVAQEKPQGQDIPRNWSEAENQLLKSMVIQAGFPDSSIEDIGEYFLVENDILFEKSALEAGAVPLQKGAHYRSQYVVRDDKAHVLTVRVDASARGAPPSGPYGSVYGWVEATMEAIAAWNELGYFVKFQYVESGTADIVISGGYQSRMEWLIAATFPSSSGMPGNKILVRTDWPSTVSARKLEMAHALGHTIGLHHTDGGTSAVVGSSTRVSPYATIPSTPASDAASIMSPLPYFEDPWPAAGFSFGDSQAMRRLYSSHIKATPNNIHRYAVDVTGDGRADLVTFDEDGVVVSVANSWGGFGNERLWNNQYGSRAASGGWNNTGHVRALADVNGDGRADVVGFGQAGVYVALSNGSAFVSLPSAASTTFHYNHGWRTDRHIRVLADVNGDGRADIVGFGENDVVVSTGRVDGYFDAPAIWHTDFAFSDGWNSVQNVPRFVKDVTGDGRADIVGFGYGNIIVGVSTGSGFTAATWGNTFCYNDGWRDNLHIRTFGDVNGDGKMDIVGFGEQDAVVGISTGSSFVNVLGSSVFGRLDGYDKTRTVRLVADATGDNRADVIAISENEVLVGVSNGSSFSVSTWHTDFAQNDGWRVADHLRTVADVTGDGKVDLVALGYNEGVVGFSTGGAFTAQLWY